MTDKSSRRSFLSRLGLGSLSLVALPKLGMARDYTEENTGPIIATTALGFQWQTIDPFLFCVHHEDYFPKGNDLMAPEPYMLKGRNLGDDFIVKDGWRMYHGKTIPGFPHHPHRGFETITVVRKGMVDHADSMGAAGRYGDGDVQWMTAGGGIQHSEMFPLINKDKDNPMELFQIWLNLPRRNKMVQPHYKMLWSEAIPKLGWSDDNGKNTMVEIIAGTLHNTKAPSPPPNSWASDSRNEVAIWNIKMEPGAQWTLPAASPGLNRVIYYYDGPSIEMAGQQIEHYHSVQVKSDEPIKIKNGNTTAGLLVLQGKPINEPVVQYGPFVMNTREEIRQAFEDYQRTQFGGWPWSSSGQVHASNRGRFAKHADGRVVNRS